MGSLRNKTHCNIASQSLVSHTIGSYELSEKKTASIWKKTKKTSIIDIKDDDGVEDDDNDADVL